VASAEIFKGNFVAFFVKERKNGKQKKECRDYRNWSLPAGKSADQR
jgi:hypothetical protein